MRAIIFSQWQLPLGVLDAKWRYGAADGCCCLRNGQTTQATAYFTVSDNNNNTHRVWGSEAFHISHHNKSDSAPAAVQVAIILSLPSAPFWLYFVHRACSLSVSLAEAWIAITSSRSAPGQLNRSLGRLAPHKHGLSGRFRKVARGKALADFTPRVARPNFVIGIRRHYRCVTGDDTAAILLPH